MKVVELSSPRQAAVGARCAHCRRRTKIGQWVCVHQDNTLTLPKTYVTHIACLRGLVDQAGDDVAVDPQSKLSPKEQLAKAEWERRRQAIIENEGDIRVA